MFNSSKKNIKYQHWIDLYMILINCYKNTIGHKLIVYKTKVDKVTINGVKISKKRYEHNLNIDLLKKHFELVKGSS